LVFNFLLLDISEHQIISPLLLWYLMNVLSLGHLLYIIFNYLFYSLVEVLGKHKRNAHNMISLIIFTQGNSSLSFILFFILLTIPIILQPLMDKISIPFIFKLTLLFCCLCPSLQKSL
jgi:hypothetical protein